MSSYLETSVCFLRYWKSAWKTALEKTIYVTGWSFSMIFALAIVARVIHEDKTPWNWKTYPRYMKPGNLLWKKLFSSKLKKCLKPTTGNSENKLWQPCIHAETRG